MWCQVKCIVLSERPLRHYYADGHKQIITTGREKKHEACTVSRTLTRFTCMPLKPVERACRSDDTEHQELRACLQARRWIWFKEKLRIIFGNKIETHSYYFKHNVPFAIFDSFQEKLNYEPHLLVGVNYLTCFLMFCKSVTSTLFPQFCNKCKR